MTETKKSLKNILIITAIMVLGFFIPLFGVIGMILLLINSQNNSFILSRDEKTMASLGAIVLTIYFIVNLIYNYKYPAETPETTSELLRLLFLI